MNMLQKDRGSEKITAVRSAVCLCLMCVISLLVRPLGVMAQTVSTSVLPDTSKGAVHEASSEGDNADANEAPKPTTKSEKAEKKHRGTIVAAPLPMSSSAIGTGIVPILGYIFPFSTKDKVSPPSTVGVAGLITNNGSRAFLVGGQLFLKEDNYEVTAGYGRGSLDYNVYGIGVAAGGQGLKLPL
ncbi:MAG: hypothetical protein ACXVPK_13640, partial [Tumebacillaceae bacterium]